VLIGSPASAATTQQTFLTFYGWYDNTPPGGDIAYPQIHNTAGGTGTFSNPITFATSSAELSPGTKVYVPRVKKYFIMEDSCQECEADWSSHGPNGGPGLRHIDLWIGGQGGSAFDAIDCEDALTHYNPDSTPVLEPVIANPSSSEVVDPTPIFNTSTGACYGGAQPNITLGQYRNVSNGQCLESPGTTAGTALKTAACNGSTAQTFKFHGAFLEFNSLCANNSSNTIKLATCTGGPSQQWSINPNLTISDIQTGQKCFRASGTNVVAGSCSGTLSQWNFTASVTDNFSLAVSPSSGSALPGDTVTATVQTAVVSGTAQTVALSAPGATFAPPSVTAGGSSVMTVTAPATPGSYTITITGTAPAVTHTATFTLTVTPPGGTGRYEAENALISQGAVATNHLNFSGTGFVDYTNVSGSYVEFTVSATAAGNATVVIGYANGTTTNRPMDVSVNGVTAASGSAFNGTANWDTWAAKTYTLALAAGTNKIRFTATTANGGPNVDYIDVSGTTPQPPVTKYEAENATISQGILETLHPGYSGTAYVNGDNVIGSYVEFTVTAAVSGPAQLRVRYANGTTANRPASIIVNGTTIVASQAFSPTANWDTWADINLTVTLNAGSNTIRLTGTTATGPANIDFIELS
jgi:hypothetical protein